MRRERDDRHLHPVREWQRAKQRIELGSAVGGVEANRRRRARGCGRTPETKEVAARGEPGRRDRLGVLPLLDLGLGRPVRNLDLELDQKLQLHGLTVIFLPAAETTHQVPPKWTKPCPFTSPAFLSSAKK